MSAPQQLECRIVITYWVDRFDLGMYDPVGMKYEPLGRHSMAQADKIIGDLRTRMERERHRVTYSEVTGPR